MKGLMKMTEREKLIDLLQNVPADYEGNRGVGTIADYLLKNGVIILPCSIGDTVYYHKTLCDGKYTVVIEEDTVKRFLINRIETLAIISFNHALSCDDFGKTVFLTREEAEKALEERKNENETR